LEEVSHDPYLARSKPPEPALCPQCGVVYHRGRWQRAPRPEKAHEHLCPACQRIKDRYPAGYVKLSGNFATHRDEIRRLVQNEEQREAADHPLQRIMDIMDNGGVITITTTDGIWRAGSVRLCITPIRANWTSSTARTSIWCGSIGRDDPAPWTNAAICRPEMCGCSDG
jgi:hypothetical protein